MPDVRRRDVEKVMSRDLDNNVGLPVLESGLLQSFPMTVGVKQYKPASSRISIHEGIE